MLIVPTGTSRYCLTRGLGQSPQDPRAIDNQEASFKSMIAHACKYTILCMAMPKRYCIALHCAETHFTQDIANTESTVQPVMEKRKVSEYGMVCGIVLFRRQFRFRDYFSTMINVPAGRH